MMWGRGDPTEESVGRIGSPGTDSDQVIAGSSTHRCEYQGFSTLISRSIFVLSAISVKVFTVMLTNKVVV